MEGYFVRTLGMHRVYNSAFMNMLLKEENDKYRDLITNTLEFEPEILKRYVNFMSNPDEETAVKQFGGDEKYFGVCVLMVTLPGLPMFGHGQIEGFYEKYGMEYQRSYYDEEPNQWLIDRHIKEIFPLTKKRYLFSQVHNFWFFDFVNNHHQVDENVFAYTNAEFGQKALVLYNNKYSVAKGKIKISSPKLVQFGASQQKELKKLSLSDALQLKSDDNIYYIFKEHKSNLQFIRSGHDFRQKGFLVELNQFEYKVFLDFVEVTDKGGECKKLSEKLAGHGTTNVFYSLEEIHYEEFHSAFEDLFDRESLLGYIKYAIELDSAERELDLSFMNEKLLKMITPLKKHFEVEIDTEKLIDVFEEELGVVRAINELIAGKTAKKEHHYFNIKKSVIYSQHHDYIEHSAVFITLYLINNLSLISNAKLTARQFIDDTYLYNAIRNVLKRFGKGESAVEKDLNLLLILADNYKKYILIAEIDEKKKCFFQFFAGLFNDPLAKAYLNINQYRQTTYFGKENFEELVDWFFSIVMFELLKLKPSKENFEKTEIKILEMFKLSDEIKSIAVRCGFKLDIFLDLLENL